MKEAARERRSTGSSAADRTDQAGETAAPHLRAVSAVAAEVVPFTAHVLFIGNNTRAWAALSASLDDIGVTSRATLSADSLFALRTRELPELLLLDDDATGFEPLELVRRVITNPRLRDIPIVVLSSNCSLTAKVEAFTAGVVDYVCVPAEPIELLVRVVAHLRTRRTQLEAEQHSRELEGFVLEQVSEITESQMATIVAVAHLAESRDYQTGGHLERVQQYCRLLAEKLSEHMRFNLIDQVFIENIEYASTLHDIGKVAISDSILLKADTLTEAEFEEMKKHTVLGAQTLEAVSRKYPSNDFVEMGIKIARWHHERWDGTGYPDGLTSEEIPLPARIMAVADVYDALVSERSYKQAFTHEESCDIIESEAGLHFDPDVVAAFLALRDEFKRIGQG